MIGFDVILTPLAWLSHQLELAVQEITPPRWRNFSYFDIFILLHIVVLSIHLLIPLFRFFLPWNLKSFVLKLLMKTPFVRNKINKEMCRMKQIIKDGFQAHEQPKLNQFPMKPIQTYQKDSCEDIANEGKLSGSRYPPTKHSQVVSRLATSPIFMEHPAAEPLIRALENDVLQMTADFLNYKVDGKGCGLFLSGGTESILMAILALKRRAQQKGITHPNFIVCQTAHVAGFKACEYFGIERRFVPYDPVTTSICLKGLKKAIDANTIGVYTSYPNYPFGTCDDLEGVSEICKARDIPMHLDLCLGGFVVPFLKDHKLRIPASVKTISLDPHKYGLSAKGCSIVLFGEQSLKQSLRTASLKYMESDKVIGMSGRRSGVEVASAWISMKLLGLKGFKENAEILRASTLRINQKVLDLGYRIIGDPSLCVFNMSHKSIPTPAIQSEMKKRGWGVSANCDPVYMRYSLTPMNCQKIDVLIKDLEDSTRDAAKVDKCSLSTELELYGACGKIPEHGTKAVILENLLDAFADLT